MTLDELADELYGLPLAEFTAARNARAKRAREEGDRNLAEQIKDLEKPTVAGWLVNRLAREDPDELAPLRDLGARLREATTKLRGDDLRTLTRQRHQLVGALVAQARRLGADEGQQVSEQVARALERTFDAALADADAAEHVLAGRLTDALQPEGFVLGGTAPARAEKPKPRGNATARRGSPMRRGVATAPARRRLRPTASSRTSSRNSPPHARTRRAHTPVSTAPRRQSQTRGQSCADQVRGTGQLTISTETPNRSYVRRARLSRVASGNRFSRAEKATRAS